MRVVFRAFKVPPDTVFAQKALDDMAGRTTRVSTWIAGKATYGVQGTVMKAWIGGGWLMLDVEVPDA